MMIKTYKIDKKKGTKNILNWFKNDLFEVLDKFVMIMDQNKFLYPV